MATTAPAPLSDVFPSAPRGPERGPIRRLSSWFRRATSFAAAYDPLVKPPGVEAVYPFVYPPLPATTPSSDEQPDHASTPTPAPVCEGKDVRAYLTALARQADELPVGSGPDAPVRHLQLAEVYLDGLALALRALLAEDRAACSEAEAERIKEGAARCAELAVWHLARSSDVGTAGQTGECVVSMEAQRLRADVERRVVRLVLDPDVRVHPVEVDASPLRAAEVFKTCDAPGLPDFVAQLIDALTAFGSASLVRRDAPSTGPAPPLSALLSGSLALRAILSALADRLSITPLPHVYLSVLPGIDPEVLAQWLPLQAGVMRLRLSLAVVSKGLKVAAAGDEAEGHGRREAGLIELDDEDLEVDRKPLVKEESSGTDPELKDEPGVKVELDQVDVPAEGTSLGSKRHRRTSSAASQATKRLKTGMQDFAVLDTSSDADNSPADGLEVDPGRDLIFVLDLIEDLMHGKARDQRFGCSPQDVVVLTRRRPWVIDEHACDSDADAEEDSASEESSDGSASHSGSSAESRSSNSKRGTPSRPRSPPPELATAPNAEAPPALLWTVFVLYDRYIEQQRAVWMELPFPKMKCDRFTEGGAVGQAWRRVIGELVFKVIGTVAAIKLGMDESQLAKWQEENDSALRALKRRRQKKT